VPSTQSQHIQSREMLPSNEGKKPVSCTLERRRESWLTDLFETVDEQKLSEFKTVILKTPKQLHPWSGRQSIPKTHEIEHCLKGTSSNQVNEALQVPQRLLKFCREKGMIGINGKIYTACRI
jgi:hypothetical protein